MLRRGDLDSVKSYSQTCHFVARVKVQNRGSKHDVLPNNSRERNFKERDLQWYSQLNASFSLSEALSKKAAAENMLGQLNNKVVDSESER